MVIDARTRLPHGHLANRAADMQHHARRLNECARNLARLMAELEAIDVGQLVRVMRPLD